MIQNGLSKAAASLATLLNIDGVKIEIVGGCPPDLLCRNVQQHSFESITPRNNGRESGGLFAFAGVRSSTTTAYGFYLNRFGYGPLSAAFECSAVIDDRHKQDLEYLQQGRN